MKEGERKNMYGKYAPNDSIATFSKDKDDMEFAERLRFFLLVWWDET